MFWAVLQALSLLWRYAKVPRLGGPQCFGWHHSHQQIIVTQCGFYSDAVCRVLREHTGSFILTNLVTHKTLEVLNIATTSPIFLPSTGYGIMLGTQSALSEFILRNSPTPVFQKPHVLAFWSAKHSANSLVFLPLLGIHHTDTNQLNFTVWFDDIKFERNKIVATCQNVPLWPSKPNTSCKAPCTSGTNSFCNVCVLSMQGKF